ncbi:Crp/Fnr family transcriptional regulator [Vibrio mexicanus]|uniref:Crp/Fnr family transcriptional regulator n=1 Tax=Vibrio mexicanus TaxID=1004326 RepID=UPI00063C4A98|nr:Crp/Fnr family transcriptional regulator [Vibrio mexicanus]
MEFSAFIDKEGQIVRKDTGEHVFMQGDNDSSLYLIKQGIVKAYYVTDEGQERVKSFLTEGDVIGSTAAAYQKQPTSFGLVCLEPTTLVKFSFEKLHNATLKNHQLANELIEFLLQFAMKKEGRERELLCFSAEQRYQNLLKNQPELVDRVTQNDIARYLGVTPVA